MKLKLLLLFFIPCLSSQLNTNTPEFFFTASGMIAFTSDAPLEIIKASSNKLRGLINVEDKSFSFRVAYRSFEGFNSGLQREHFNDKYMESEKYHEAIFNGEITDKIDFSKDGTYEINVTGKLNIHGIVKERIINSILIIGNGSIHIESKFNVLLDDHNIRIPKVVTQKIATEIFVEVKADLKKRELSN